MKPLKLCGNTNIEGNNLKLCYKVISFNQSTCFAISEVSMFMFMCSLYITVAKQRYFKPVDISFLRLPKK